MNEGLTLTIVIALGLSSFVALFSVMGVLFPRIVSETRWAADKNPGRTVLLGFVNFTFFTILAVATSTLAKGADLPVVRLVALLIISVLGIGIAFGLAGMAPLVGARLLPERGEVAQTVWGSLALLLACLAPYLGWFALLPYLVWRGLGGLLIALFNRRLEKPQGEVQPGE